MMSCDLIGFHTSDYVLNFMDSIQRGLGCRIDKSEFLAEHYDRTYIGKVIYLQIAVPSRTDVKEYQDLKDYLDKLVGKLKHILMADLKEY
ncbi:Alpha_alphatrehalosephosphate synthase A-like, partial [Caligus rogercresseyi]